MAEIFDKLKELIKEFPTQSGVYLMKNNADKIIYVGKAKNVRNRVKSYFQDSKDHSPKTKALVLNICEIEYLLTKTEVEAFLLEASLIKKHRPKYNIRLKDDKSYPYIQLSWKDDFPRLYLSRKVKRDGSLYFGPYTSGGAVFGTIRFLNRLFKIRDCTDHFFKGRTRPCMTHQIGRCTAPCVKLISKEDYRSDAEGAKDFLKGRSKKLIKDLEKKMLIAAAEEKFEVAAKMRDSFFAIRNIVEKQTVIDGLSDKDQDAISYYGDERGVLVETLHIRSGRVIGNRPHFIANVNPNSPDEDFSHKLNKKMYRAGMRSILSELARSGRLSVIENITMEAPRTKQLAEKIKGMGFDSVLIVTDSLDENLYLSARNLANVLVVEAQHADPVNLVRFPNVLLTRNAVKKIEEMLA